MGQQITYKKTIDENGNEKMEIIEQFWIPDIIEETLEEKAQRLILELQQIMNNISGSTP